MKKSYIILIIINAVTLSVFFILFNIKSDISGLLNTQTMAERWGGGNNKNDNETKTERHTQISIFTDSMNAFTLDGIYMNRADIDKGLSDNSIKKDAFTLPDGTVISNGKLWTDAFSGYATMNVSNMTDSVDVKANGAYTGGDYFLFHPLDFTTGNYYTSDEITKDRAVIDETLAWQLYGATDVAGMPFKINGSVFIIAGVVKPYADKASKDTYGDKPRVYIPYEAALKMNEYSAFSCYEVCLPEPIKGLGLKIFKEAVLDDNTLGGAADNEKNIIVENSQRYGYKNLFSRIFNYSKLSVKTNAIIFPYFENAALINENRAALLLLFAILSLIVPIVTFVWLVRKGYRKVCEKFGKKDGKISKIY